MEEEEVGVILAVMMVVIVVVVVVVVVIVVVVDVGTVFIKKQSLFGDYRIQSHPVVSIRVSPKLEHYQRASTSVHCIQHINRGPYSCTCRICTYICPQYMYTTGTCESV